MELRFSDAFASSRPGEAVVPAGVAVRHGRLTLPKSVLSAVGSFPRERVSVVVGLRSACWLGAGSRGEPQFGRLSHRGVATMDDRGRVVLDRHVRAYLALADPDSFAVVVVGLGSGGVLLVPTEDFDRRLARVSLP